MNKNIYVRELNEKDFNKIKMALIVELNELNALDTLENALDSKLSDVVDTIDIENVLNTSQRDLNIQLYDLFCPYDLYNEFEIEFGIENFENSLNDNLESYIYDLIQQNN